MRYLFQHQELLIRLQDEPVKEPMKLKKIKPKTKRNELKQAS